MYRALLTLGLALALVVGGALAASAAFTCKVKEISGNEAILKCKAKDAKKLAVGDKVKIKKKTEGC